MSYDPIPTGPIDRPGPKGFASSEQAYTELMAVLREAGIELGDHDIRIADWLSHWEWSTVATVASWIKRTA
jgi:hypothetical protein